MSTTTNVRAVISVINKMATCVSHYKRVVVSARATRCARVANVNRLLINQWLIERLLFIIYVLNARKQKPQQLQQQHKNYNFKSHLIFLFTNIQARLVSFNRRWLISFSFPSFFFWLYRVFILLFFFFDHQDSHIHLLTFFF